MFPVHVTSLLTFFSQLLVTVALTQNPLLEETHKPLISADRDSVAVVGAGISGAQFAFELGEWAQPSTRYDVTIFERESNVGGRIQSVSLPPNHPDHS
jgi:heterodisulfide reductase subunit A-like polyferredoxin